MQKKIIALAVAGLVSGAAFAQSNVTIYGVADVGYQRSSSSDTGNFESRNAFESGQYSGSRIGFRGTEDLGGGLSAIFVYEMGLNVDQGASAQGGREFGRQSYAGLSSKSWGTVAIGRQYTPQFLMLNKFDPFSTGTSGDASYGRGVYSMASGRLVGSPGEIRLDNLAAYISPTFSGFNVIAGYTFDGTANEENRADGAKNGNMKVWAINPNYSNGPLNVSFNYHRASVDTLDAKARVWDIGGSYDFGVVKVAGMYGRTNEDVGVNDNKESKWMLGATMPVTANGKVLFSYTRFSSNSDSAALDDDKASKWAVGYVHSLSKRTDLYASYAKLSTNNNAEGQFSVNGTGGVVSGDYTSGINLGMRHTF